MQCHQHRETSFKHFFPKSTPQKGSIRRVGTMAATNCMRPRQQRNVAVQQQGNVLVQGVVSAMTESLRVLGVGQRQYQEIISQAAVSQPLLPGDVAGVMDRLTADFGRAYFVTGIIDDSIYEDDCTFVDPTVRFQGLQLWKRNLQLLVPFLVQPEIKLHHLRQLGAQTLQAEWTLQTGLALPWRPFINVLGSTIYTLNAEQNKILEHAESWDISATQALILVLTPGSDKRRQQQAAADADVS